MKLKYLTLLALAGFALPLALSSCKKEGCTDEAAKNYDEDAKDDDGSCRYEFVADNSTFSGWSSWSLDATATGVDPSLGEAHAGNDSNSVRNVYFLNGQAPEGGSYPVGTVVVKQTIFSNGDEMLTAMVKRGDDFDPSAGDWEYFVLNADGTIADDGAMRGADLMDGMCKSCHVNALTDHIFSK